MPYYHTHIMVEGHEYYEHDQSLESIKKLAESYNKGELFRFSGILVDPYKINKIRIFKTGSRDREILGARVWDVGTNVTRKFIGSLPRKSVESIPLTKNVFIVHGRDHKSLNELKVMLVEFGLNPVILHEQPSGSMTIVEKLERYSKDIGFAFILLTPDDALVPTTKYVEIDKKKGTQRPIYMYHGKPIFRARQNVFLEFGFFIAKITRKRVCCLYKENTELPYDMPSDMHGIIYMPFKNSVDECRDMIIKELKEVGYKIEI